MGTPLQYAILQNKEQNVRLILEALKEKKEVSKI